MTTKELDNGNKEFSVHEIKIMLEPIFAADGVKRAVLFGSYAKGSAVADSDIDILVDSGLRGLDFVGLIENMRETLQRNVDVLDVHYIDNGSRIEREIMATGGSIW
ncbi:MAG: nucleotidyltransferase domain-containing protein [Defluviitaleaceae bacterium]|nr:nucleotidyltransferase domain-containing protein [Defluviitaleaceae bacterium]